MRIMSSSVERQFRPRRCKLDGARDCSTQVAAVGALVMRRQVWVGSRRTGAVGLPHHWRRSQPGHIPSLATQSG